MNSSINENPKEEWDYVEDLCIRVEQKKYIQKIGEKRLFKK